LRYVRKHCFSVMQQTGDTIFVPSNWFHTVENIHDTLSINHNWLNGSNIRKCWEYVASKVQCSRTNANNGPNACNPNHVMTHCSAAIVNVDDAIEKIDDDVLLLWKVVEKKAKSYIDLTETICTPNQKHDLLGILFVVDNMLSLYKGRDLTSTSANELSKTEQLRHTLATILQLL
jgi:hypothetical protein